METGNGEWGMGNGEWKIMEDKEMEESARGSSRYGLLHRE